MRFDSKAYREVYPRQKAKEKIESAVDSFTPTQDELDGKEGEEDADGDGSADNDDSEQ